jgi:hypothetical protein
VENNTTPEEGGGIDNRFGTVTLKAGSRVVGNTAVAFDGGGISNQSGTVTLEAGSLVKGNTARYGGGISSFDGTVILEAGSRVTGNTSTSFDGGGIIIHNMQNTTISIAEDTIVTDNEPDNCAPMDTIPNCIG